MGNYWRDIRTFVADTYLSRNHYNPEKKFEAHPRLLIYFLLLYQLFDKMSHQQEDVVDDTQEEYINVNEVAEEVADDDQAPPDEEDEEMELDDEHEILEIDMSNNSWTYF